MLIGMRNETTDHRHFGPCGLRQNDPQRSHALCSGTLRKLGRVDHGNAFLDTHALEKQRGITIFSKQAELNYSGCHFYVA